MPREPSPESYTESGVRKKRVEGAMRALPRVTHGIKNRKGNTSIVDGHLETTVAGQAINQQGIEIEGYRWTTNR